ncbi:MAG: hypothetical protein NC252_05890 [Roseburia sp.]|nr:hypothetical protein [Roseburia sp.]MCM1420464.1 hypothetical protein [Bacteroides sp.]
MTDTSTTCLLVLTHLMNFDLLHHLEVLKEASQGVTDMYVIYDCANGKPDIACDNNIPIYMFSSSELPKFFHQGEHRLPSPLLALMNFAKSHKYDRYLLMENDIVLNGDWRDFFQTIEKERDIDYIHIATDVLGNPQAHWPIKFIKNNPFKKVYFSWCQLFLVSHCYLMDIDTFIQQNDTFYYEFLLPTMAYNGSYRIRQFENFGYNFQVSWGPAELYEYKYLHETHHNTFYHPVKNLRLITKL